jgi:pullulanase/glycogen debranching enzyme
MDYTGTGNSLNVRHPHALQLIIKSCSNAHYEDIEMRMPENGYGPEWTVVLDTATGQTPGTRDATVFGDAKIPIIGRSLVVLERAA